MDHPCYKCGQSIEDGKAFCLQCGAPQIRVAMPEAVAVAAGPASLNGSIDDVAAFPLDSPIVSEPLSSPVIFTGIEWRRAFRACAMAAAVSSLVMSLGLMVPPLAGLGSGCLAVILYHRRNPVSIGNARSGAQLGALSGLLFFGVWSVFKALTTDLFHAGGELHQKMLDAVQQAASRATDPDVKAYFDRMKTPEGLATMLILSIVFFLLISIAAGSLGGALTGAFFSRRNRP
jgi:hypothetical protein